MKYVILIIALLGAGVGGLMYLQRGGPVPKGGALTIYCAAGVRKPVDAVSNAYQKEFDTQTNFRYGGSGELIGIMRAANTGDLYIAADDKTIDEARKYNLIREVIPFASQTPVLAVAQGNPKSIHSLDDLLRADVKFAICDPERASIGQATKIAMGDRWEKFHDKATVIQPTVTDIATAVTTGAVDAAVVWDATVRQFPKLITIDVPDLAKYKDTVSAAVLTSCKQPAMALRFARYLAAPQKGGPLVDANGLTPLPGDAWSPRPTMLFYGGSVNRLALEQGLQEFANREGIDLTTKFNGCGILCADMRSLAKIPGAKLPDAYYACDICFVPPVADIYPEAVILTETDIVLAVQKGNPHNIKTLADLAQPGLKVGICNSQASSLGYLTKGILTHSMEPQTYATFMAKNVKSQVPTADTLINQLQTGSLDAAIVYLVTVSPPQVKQRVDYLPLNVPGAKAVQPFAVAAHSPNAQLAHRLLDFLQSDPDRFKEFGFRWRGDKPIASADIHIPEWMKQANSQP